MAGNNQIVYRYLIFLFPEFDFKNENNFHFYAISS